MPTPNPPPMDPTSSRSRRQAARARPQAGRGLSQGARAHGRERRARRRHAAPASTSSATPSRRPRACTCGRTASCVWHDPEDENLHVEIAVCDASDGRFVPALTVTGTLIDPDGNEVGTHEHPLLWHPMIYHYGRNWKVPQDGEYTLKVHIEPPTFMRHDEINGCRFDEAGRDRVHGRQGRARAGLTRRAGAVGAVGERLDREAGDGRGQQHGGPRAERVGDDVRHDEGRRRRRPPAPRCARAGDPQPAQRAPRAAGDQHDPAERTDAGVPARRRSRAAASRRRRARSPSGHGPPEEHEANRRDAREQERPAKADDARKGQATADDRGHAGDAAGDGEVVGTLLAHAPRAALGPRCEVAAHAFER